MEGRTVIVCGAVVTGFVGAFGVSVLLWKWLKSRYNNRDHDDCEWTEEMVDEWVAYHYCPSSEYVPFACVSKEALDFPLKVAKLCSRHKSDAVLSRALDVGCATGRISFELAAAFNEVIGLDISELCVNKANQLKNEGKVTYNVTLEGTLVQKNNAIVNPNIDRNRVQFVVGDACALPNDIGQFGLVLITNTLCHLPDPMLFLETMKDTIVPAGILVIVDYYGWDEMLKLPQDRWIAGYENEGEQIRGFEGLKKVLGPHFILLEEDNMQCLVRFCPRMFSLQISHASVWMRKID